MTDEPTTKTERAHALVRRNVLWALGVGLLPFPIADFVALTGLQIKMIKELSDLYGVPFSDSRARTLVWSLVTGLGSVVLTGTILGSLVKAVPVVGQVVGAVGVAAAAGALTQALGNLFIMHFEAGGTLLTFDVEAMRAHFRKEYVAAKITVQRIHTTKDSVAP